MNQIIGEQDRNISETIEMEIETVENLVEDVDNMTVNSTEQEGQNEDDDDQEDEVETEVENNKEQQGEIESCDAIKFSPPVYIQRYLSVCEIIKKEILANVKSSEETSFTVFEVGCAEMKMMTYMKNIPYIEKLIFLDIDKCLVQDSIHRLTPLPIEYIMKREIPLLVEAYVGDVCLADPRILSASPYIIVGIEIIEHLHSEVLQGFEISVFGVYRPQIVILTTPNSDFNTVFKLEPGKFRHWDHKFEFSRLEFKVWCDKIVSMFPVYTYKIEGIGEGPEETIELGHVSQMVIFTKTGDYQETSEDELQRQQYTQNIVKENAYELIGSIKYPIFKDERPSEEKILDEFVYYVSTYRMTSTVADELRCEGKTELPVDLKLICELSRIAATEKDFEFIKNTISDGGYKVELHEGNWHALFPVPPEDDDEDEFEEDMTPLPDTQESQDSAMCDIDEEVW